MRMIQRLLSMLAGRLAGIKNRRIAEGCMRLFCKYFNIDLTDVLNTDFSDYPDFNAFFIRQLKPDARPIDNNKSAVISPVDGTLLTFGEATSQTILQIKNQPINLNHLLGHSLERTEWFENGYYLNFYLAPHNYHRVHMPLSGILKQMIYIPGHLFSVNPKKFKKTQKIFTRNERLVCIFETNDGPMAVILIGAMLVGGIKTVWHGLVNADHQDKVREWHYPNPKTPEVKLSKGDELGLFQYGSSVVILLPKGNFKFEESLKINTEIKMGQALIKKQQSNKIIHKEQDDGQAINH